MPGHPVLQLGLCCFPGILVSAALEDESGLAVTVLNHGK
jgi:hypothetical protein